MFIKICFSTIIFYLLAQNCIAQEIVTIETSPNIKSYVPKGWGLIDTINCDLNNDRIQDTILI